MLSITKLLRFFMFILPPVYSDHLIARTLNIKMSMMKHKFGYKIFPNWTFVQRALISPDGENLEVLPKNEDYYRTRQTLGHPTSSFENYVAFLNCKKILKYRFERKRLIRQLKSQCITFDKHLPSEIINYMVPFILSVIEKLTPKLITVSEARFDNGLVRLYRKKCEIRKMEQLHQL